jgi:serine/threonine protein kinase
VVERCSTMVGSPHYVAPEVILGSGYDFCADLWSLGVLIYELLAGYNPMEGPLQQEQQKAVEMDVMELFRCITEEEYVPLPTEIANASPAAAQLIDGLLVKDPSSRLVSAAIVLQHKWFNDMDYNTLRQQQLPAPWVPEFKATPHTLETPYFDNWDYLAKSPETCIFKESYPKLTAKEAALFAGLNTATSNNS